MKLGELESAITQGAEQIRLSSQARMLEELYKILRRPYSLGIFEACQTYGLLEYMLPVLNDRWNDEPGQKARRLLEKRDALLAENVIFPSRFSAVACMILPFLIDQFSRKEHDGLWKNFSGIDKQIQDIIKGFLSPYKVPRYAVAKVRDILLVQPKLMTTKNRKRMLNHPEYNRSRDLFEIVVRGLDFDHELLKYWPEQQNVPQKRGRKKE